MKRFLESVKNVISNSFIQIFRPLNLEIINTNKLINNSAFITDVGYHETFTYQDKYLKGNLDVQRPMRIMMLGLRGFPDVQGGIETHSEHLAPILVKLGCDLEVVVRSGYQKDSVGNVWCGVKFTKIWAPKSKGFEAIIHTFLGVMYAAVKRPDILHIHAIGPALMTPLARLLGLRVVVTHHGPDYNRQKWGAAARNILLLGEWMGMRFSNSRIVISNVIKDLVTYKHTMYSELIHNGVVLPSLDINSDHLDKFGLTKGKYIIHVGRMVPEKRHLDLISAFNQANLIGYKLVIIGSSDHPDEYVESILQAASNNPNIVLTGFQTGDTLRSLYTHSALFVLPSSHEGLSISLLEALSYGLPVVASDIPANLEVGLEPSSYFRLGDVDQLTDLLKQYTMSSDKLGSRNQTRDWIGTKYNWKLIAEKTYKVYSGLVR